MILIIVYFPKTHFCHYQVFWTLQRASVGPQQRWALDWIRTIANFVEFGLDPECKALQNLGSRQDLDWVNGKEMRYFCCETAAFFQFSGLHLDLYFTFKKIVGLWLDLHWVLKNQDWIWIAKYDSPLIFGPQIDARLHHESIFVLYLLPCSTVTSRHVRGVLAARYRAGARRLRITGVEDENTIFYIAWKWQFQNGMNKPCVHWMDCVCLVKKLGVTITTKKEFTYR